MGGLRLKKQVVYSSIHEEPAIRHKTLTVVNEYLTQYDAPHLWIYRNHDRSWKRYRNKQFKGLT